MDEKSNKKGFSGLSSLASKMEDHASSAGKKLKPKAESPLSSKPDNKPASHSTPSTVAASKQQPEKPSSGTSGSSSGWKWLVGIVAVIAVVAIYNKQSQKVPSTTSTFTPPSSSHETNAVSPPVVKPVTPPPPKVKPKVEPKIEPKITFEMPQVGRDNILSVAQIRWCQREDIRLGAQKPLIKNNIQVSEFNISVDDYNQRCGSFRYRPGSLERAKREVEKLRIEIEKAARAEFAPEIKQATKPPVKQTAPVQQKPASNSAQTKFSSRDVREVQTLLSELGYQPGPIDGQYGERTKSAIAKFLNQEGINISSSINENLISALKAQVEKNKKPTVRPRSSMNIEDAIFFVALTDAAGKQEVFESNRVPYHTENSCYGWRAKLASGHKQRIHLREILNLPSQPLGGWPVVSDGSRKITPSKDQKSAATERTLSVDSGWVQNMWCVGEGDPLGPYSIDVFLDDQFIKTFKFEVYSDATSAGQKRSDLSSISATDREGIIKTCKYKGSPADVYSCQKTELANLQRTGPGPDLSRLSQFDREGIIKTCKYKGSPADVYSCQKTELANLQRTGPGPDLSRLSQFDREGVIKTCKYKGSPADIYTCQYDELRRLKH